MTEPPAPPPPRPTALPPTARSRAALGLAAAAAESRFMLQSCAGCGTVQYPPRDACRGCLSVDLPWRDIRRGGTLLAETSLRVSTAPYFSERAPWRIGTVLLDAGPRTVAFVHRDVPRHGRVRMELRLDRAGQAILVALPDPSTPEVETDPLLRQTTANPWHADPS